MVFPQGKWSYGPIRQKDFLKSGNQIIPFINGLELICKALVNSLFTTDKAVSNIL